MYVVGLTGGIGAGKSTVAAMLAERGAFVLDADAVYRELAQPGMPVLAELADEFGREILRTDGSLDRPKLAAIVFGDPHRLRRLNEITHPKIGASIAQRIASQQAGTIVVVDVPLLESAPLLGIRDLLDAVIVVLASAESQVGHLVGRGMDERDARSRMAAQGGDEQRLEIADHVIRNDGSLEDLKTRVDELWESIVAKAEEHA